MDSVSKTPTVIVIGGGLAGLAASSALALAGFKVQILESKQRLGGRAGSFTDSVTGQVIDICQHVSMGCCTNFSHFCRTIKIDHLLEPQPILYFLTKDGRISKFYGDPLPAPLHLARSLLRAHYLTFWDKMRIGLGMISIWLTSPEKDPPLIPWLQSHWQNQRSIERFWNVVLTSALNESIDLIGLKYARKVMVDGFLRHRKAFEVQVPKVPLAHFYGPELKEWFDNHYISIEMNQSVESIAVENQKVQSIQLTNGKTLNADFYVSALPFDRLLGTLPKSVSEGDPFFSRFHQIQVSPITSVHLWLDREITSLPNAVVVDGICQWIFNRGEVEPGQFYYQIVVSASHQLKTLGREKIQEAILAELRIIFPICLKAEVLHSRVITEHRATFSVRPGIDSFRPTNETPIENLFLAGDWTQSDWPATMEGAVRSGYLAAEAITQILGNKKQFVQNKLR